MVPRFKPSLGWSEFYAMLKSNTGKVEEFEQAFAKKFRAVDAVSFPYGRSAQWAFLKAIGLEDEEIILPAYTCSVVAHAVTLSGNRPQFVDILPDNFNMNLDDLELAISKKTRAIIATHTFGYPQDLERLEKIVRFAEEKYGHKVWLIQDCCHAFGAEENGRMVGTAGDVAVYAFNISKMITSIFGGMLTFQDQALANKVRAWRDANFRKAGWMKGIQRRIYMIAVYVAFNKIAYGLTWWLQEKTSLLNRFTKSYHLDGKIHFPPDFLDQMLEVEAAVGLAQLDKYDNIIARRRANSVWYDQHLKRKAGWVFPPIIEGATYSHYVVRVPERKPVVTEWAAKGTHLGELIQYSIPLTPEYLMEENDAFPYSAEASLCTINFPLTETPKTVKKICRGS